MDFSEIIKSYMNTADLTAHDIATASSLSDSTLSRYINGERVPSPESDEFISLLNGLTVLLSEKGISTDDLADRLISSLPDRYTDTEKYISRLSGLMEKLSVSNSFLAKKTGYDPSYISRILSGERFPADYIKFSEQAAACFVSAMENVKNVSLPESAFDREKFEGSDKNKKERLIKAYLLYGDTSSENNNKSIIRYLEKLDEFDLNDYIKSIHFDKLIVPSFPVSSSSKHYFGVSGYKTAEVNFLKRTVLGNSTDTVFFFSDMPMEEVASDSAFTKKWLMWLAMLLKKGIKIEIVHNIDRPADEMILGLEAWIPLYMTGLISPYYLDNYNVDRISHMVRTSGNCSMIGECVGENIDSSFFLLGGTREVMNTAEARKRHIFEKAHPLMEIFKEDRDKEFRDLIKKELQKIQKDGEDYPKKLKFATEHYFKNINISLYGPELVVISKTNSPVINFAIRNPQLIDAILSLDEQGK